MENTPTPLPVADVQQPASSLGGRLVNMFAAPGDVFEEIRTSTPSSANWLVPLLLSCLVGVGYIALLSLGLAKLGRVAYGKAAFWLFGVWAVLVSAMILPGWGR